MVKLIVTDFDGVLATGFEYSWKEVWKFLGYDDTLRRQYFKKYLSGDLTYQAWCDVCCDAYRAKGLTKNNFSSIVSDLQLTDRLQEGLDLLKSKNIPIVIISGGIDSFIYELLGPLKDSFDGVYANGFHYDAQGGLERITPTAYDFENKVHGLKQLTSKYGITLQDVAFIGDNNNDIPALQAAGASVAYLAKNDDVKNAADICIDENNFEKVIQTILQKFD